MKTKKEIEDLANDYSWPYNQGNGLERFNIAKEVFIDLYNMFQKDDNSKVTRLEVIDEKGRLLTKWDCSVELSYQDDNRTLKIFVKSKDKTNEST